MSWKFCRSSIVSTITSAFIIWKNHVRAAPERMRKTCSPGLPADDRGTAGSDVTWQTVRDSRSIRKSMSGWRWCQSWWLSE